MKRHKVIESASAKEIMSLAEADACSINPDEGATLHAAVQDLL